MVLIYSPKIKFVTINFYFYRHNSTQYKYYFDTITDKVQYPYFHQVHLIMIQRGDHWEKLVGWFGVTLLYVIVTYATTAKFVFHSFLPPKSGAQI